MKMKNYLFILILLLVPKPYCQTIKPEEPIVLLIPRDVLDDYNLFTENKNPDHIQNFNGKHSRRDVVEVILLIQALRLGGLKNEIKFAIIDSYKRILVELSQGSAPLAATTFWEVDLRTNNAFIDSTQAIVKNGDFEAGFYTNPLNEKALNAKDLKDLKKLHFVSSENWTSDWQTLKALNPIELFSTSSWASMTKLVNLQRADVLLAPFTNNPDLELKVDNQSFKPIPNLKLGLKGARYFGLSKTHPQYFSIKKALKKGLLKLEQNGSIQKAFEQCGFYNKNTEHWKKLTF